MSSAELSPFSALLNRVLCDERVPCLSPKVDRDGTSLSSTPTEESSPKTAGIRRHRKLPRTACPPDRLPAPRELALPGLTPLVSPAVSDLGWTRSQWKITARASGRGSGEAEGGCQDVSSY